jgi:hypothetical protein
MNSYPVDLLCVLTLVLAYPLWDFLYWKGRAEKARTRLLNARVERINRNYGINA